VIICHLIVLLLVIEQNKQIVLVWLNVGLLFLSLYSVIFCYCFLPEQIHRKHWFIKRCSHEIAAFLFVLLSTIYPLEHSE